jgi:hypothetical protein
LVPLQNHTYPSSSKSSKQESTIFYPPFPKHQQRIPRISFKNVSTVQDDASLMPSTSSTAPTSTAPPTTTTPIPNDNNDDVKRANFLAKFDYVHMRSRWTRIELAKMPYLNEDGVLFHSPAVPSVTYNTIFQTTHDFLELGITLHMYPTFVDLPLHLRPSKARYDATKQSEDQSLRVRCLFCRGRFGGKNAKAIWERHVKEHWPKQGESTIPTPRRHHEPLSKEAQQVLLKWVDRNKEYPKEKTRRPMRQIQKRPIGSLQLS